MYEKYEDYISTTNNKTTVKDMVGQKFGRLTVIKRAPNKGNLACWWCLCDCQKDKSIEDQILTKVVGSYLRTGETQSCGCIYIEKAKILGKNNKKYNNYDLSGDYGICYTYKNQKILFDIDDYDKIKDFSWHLNTKGYAYATNVLDEGGKYIFMHNVIMDNINKEYIVDHIYHDVEGNNSSCDNRKFNLRKTTQSKNAVNKKKQSNNTSGVTGVSFRKDNQKWVVNIDIDKKHYYLGQYNTFEEAVLVRKNAEKELHNEYSPVYINV